MPRDRNGAGQGIRRMRGKRVNTDKIPGLLEESRLREKAQTLFYRALAAWAEAEEKGELVERLNDLHADEQHHLSRLTARLLELGETPRPLSAEPPEIQDPNHWEALAQAREEEEVIWYRETLQEDLDPKTRGLLEEILASEKHHSRELAGKWMSA